MTVGFSSVNGRDSDGVKFGYFLNEGQENVKIFAIGPPIGGAGGGGRIELNFDLGNIMTKDTDGSRGLGGGGTYTLGIREVEFCDEDGNKKFMLALCTQSYDKSLFGQDF